MWEGGRAEYLSYLFSFEQFGKFVGFGDARNKKDLFEASYSHCSKQENDGNAKNNKVTDMQHSMGLSGTTLSTGLN